MLVSYATQLSTSRRFVWPPCTRLLKGLLPQPLLFLRVTCELPLPFDRRWSHLSGLQLADSKFGRPGRIDLLLGVEVFRWCSMAGCLDCPDLLSPWKHVLVGSQLGVLTQVPRRKMLQRITPHFSRETISYVDERAALDHFKNHHKCLEVHGASAEEAQSETV